MLSLLTSEWILYLDYIFYFIMSLKDGMNRIAKLAGGGGTALLGIGALIYGVNVSLEILDRFSVANKFNFLADHIERCIATAATLLQNCVVQAPSCGDGPRYSLQ